MDDKKQPFELLRVVQYAFPMVFVALAFAFYLNGRAPALMAWIFAAIGFLEYCFLGLLRAKINSMRLENLPSENLSEA